jgi:hypothetical protein
VRRSWLIAAAVAAAAGPYTGTGTGLVDRFRHLDNGLPDPDHVFSDSRDSYRASFRYSFTVAADGAVSGEGSGEYASATWRIDGLNGSDGPFACDVPLTAPPFGVEVSGESAGSTLRLRFALQGARESNEDFDCGAGYTGFATESSHLADSLDLVQPPDGIAVDERRPAIAPLRVQENTGDDLDRRAIGHEWTFTIAAPPAPPGGGVPGARAACTLEGTARRDRLRGTRGDDVICGRGGRDVIDGRGGRDVIYGGPGADRIIGGAGADELYGERGHDRLRARDGERDRVDGGRGRDYARVDRQADRVRSIEDVSPRPRRGSS